MKKLISWCAVIFVTLMVSGCNIVPKSVQYQKEEEKLIGSTDIVNPVVEEIQVVLNGLGYETGNTDGRMGNQTRQAIKEFQESMGVRSTGYINKVTLTQIEDIRREKDKQALEKSYKIEVRSAYSKERDILHPEYSPTTTQIQIALKNAGFDPGAIDGKMGPKTRQAIKEFQRTKGLKPDGIVGSKTWGELGKYLK